MRRSQVFATPALAVSISDHGGELPPVAAEEERCDHYCVNFVESGEFGLGVGRRFWRMRPGDAFAWHPSAVHRYSHFRDVSPDTCLSVRFRGQLEREIEATGHLSDAAEVPVLPRTARLQFLRYRLERVLQDADALTLEQWAVELLAAIASPARNDRVLSHARFRRHADAVESVRRYVTHQFAEAHSLASLANAAGMSPFHFTRVFHELIGAPPHRFLRDLRLERALQMLRDGEPVTTTCYAVGFGNLSHFIRSFRRRFGVAPSRVRKKVQAHGERSSS
jgi:AraC family transcriptional regulator